MEQLNETTDQLSWSHAEKFESQRCENIVFHENEHVIADLRFSQSVFTGVGKARDLTLRIKTLEVESALVELVTHFSSDVQR